MLCLAVTVPCTTYLTLAPADWLPGLWSFMTMQPPPFFLFRLAIFEMILLYITLTYLLEVNDTKLGKDKPPRPSYPLNNLYDLITYL